MQNEGYLTQTAIQVLEEEAYNHIGARIDYNAHSARGGLGFSDFQVNGYFCFEMADSTAEIIISEFFSDSLICDFEENVCIPGYRPTLHTRDTLQRLNHQHIYYRPPSEKGVIALQRYIDSIKAEISTQIGTNWKITNVRPWKTKSTACDGPSGWHFDGFSRFQRKLLIYPVPPNSRNGTVEISDRSGNIITLEQEVPLCVLYDPAVLLHRGRPGINVNRPIIEVTIFPAIQTDSSLIFAGQNARSPIINNCDLLDKLVANQFKPPLRNRSRFMPKISQIKSRLSKIKRSFIKSKPVVATGGVRNIAKYLNIGGGPLFREPGWINLDSAKSDINQFPFAFTEDCILPIPTGTVHLVYSSHCFEHLSDGTVLQLLREIRRVLRPGGELVIKIPNYQLVKDALENRDASFFDKWDLDEIAKTWAVNGVTDSLENRASMIYCGYWNRQYGDHFSGAGQVGCLAYHGPAPINDDILSEVLKNKSDHQIAGQLRSIVMDRGQAHGFNHQNAWSEEEFVTLLGSNKYTIISTDVEKVKTQFGWIPGISHLDDISSYYVSVVE